MSRVTTEVRGHIFLMGLNRVEKRNAFDAEMLSALSDAFGQLEENDELRCGVLFAHGDHFTAGLDLADVGPRIMSGDQLLPEGGLDPWGIYSERKRTKPLIMAIQGTCLTLGIELALAADIIIAAENAHFAQIEIRRGIFPFGGATVRLPRRVGWGNAMRYLLTGDSFSADTAYRIGMVQEVTKVGEQLDKAVEIASTISKQAPLGVKETLFSANILDDQSIPAGVDDHLRATIRKLMATEDAQEGMLSFLERREAVFQGK